MLDTETKRRIDTARDILVGKVPDPKSQVEQITIALIYKFMDDMDRESVDFGGEASFFSGEYEKYAWTKIFDPKIGGHEMLNLYGEAIIKLNLNPNIPQLFRDIFKNAYLPYRDPETLKLFLKTINEFRYDHSEMLGDAFEYLLSVLGSQGDAGQFRTPRHIIDFIVQALEPKKGESICDPACGTAGFLISAYKHIVKTHSKPDKNYELQIKNEELRMTKDEFVIRNSKFVTELTPDERKKLMQNFTGYDISPDMVRLSLVNMYLHGFTSPKIYEYDTLTSEDRWHEYFDVILANPPFMSPKGGIKPHKKFTVQANRSEVLFVDYIAEHIHPSTGRAGIIVPEGIIFQSAGAYRQLRKMLVKKEYLYAVVSLPAGIFQPYSGVKTSILLLDKTLARKTNNILFVKIDNDGFDLGAQRRAIDKNDLTGCLPLLQQYKQDLQSGKPFVSDNKNVFLVDKETLAAKDDFNLSIDRYRINENVKQSKFEMVSVEDLIEDVKYTTKILKSDFLNFGKYPIIDQSEDFIAGYWDKDDDIFKISKPLIVFGDHTRIFKFIDFDFVLGADGVKLLQPKEIILPKYFYYCLRNLEIRNLGYSRHYKELKEIQIPLPPLSVQQQIVAKIENYQAIINGAKQVIENYKSQIDINPDWEMVELGEVCDVKSGGTPSRDKEEFWNGNIPWLRSEACKDGLVNEAKEYISEKGFENSSAKYLNPKSTLIALVGATIGKTAFLTFKATTNQNVAGLYPKNENELIPEFLFYGVQLLYAEFTSLGEFRMANLGIVKGMKIPLPPLSEQEQIVRRIEEEQALVNGNKKLIEIYEQKIKDEINKLWER